MKIEFVVFSCWKYNRESSWSVNILRLNYDKNEYGAMVTIIVLGFGFGVCKTK